MPWERRWLCRFRRAKIAPVIAVVVLELIACGGNPSTSITPNLPPGAAARFLDQSSFGPTEKSIDRVRSLDAMNFGSGFSAYIDEQMDSAATPPSNWPDIPNPLPPGSPCPAPMACLQQHWFQNALLGKDQLRQRTAFALSQIWVISGNTVDDPAAYTPFIRIMNNDAFATYDKLMKDVTLSPGMGWYLDMVNSAKAAHAANANENYARELLQLFTLGLVLLNDDGTPQLDDKGKPIPTYDQAIVQDFARTFTGWTYKNCCGSQGFPTKTSQADFTSPLVPVEDRHDTGSKKLLNGRVLPAGQSAEQDLDDALATIFAHPNLPPFVSKQLIQHLVTSNPSPPYVARISGVFKDNGFGVRGDLKAVIKAILLDPEARRGDVMDLAPSFGHLREPVLLMTGILRGLEFTVTDPSVLARGLAKSGGRMGQNVLIAPNVFNYFPPDYRIPAGHLVGPEFAILSTATAPARVNWVETVVSNGLKGDGITIELTSFRGLSPEQLTDELSARFLHGKMPPDMRSAVIGALSQLPPSTDPDTKARTGIYLVTTSSQYQVVR